MKCIKSIGAVIVLLLIIGCSNEPKESDQVLTDYKNKQLEKAKKVEETMNKRADLLNKELDELEKKKKGDPQ